MPAEPTLLERKRSDVRRRRDRDGGFRRRPEAGAIRRATCFGGATVDRLYQALVPVRPGTSNPVARSEAFGGVAHNVAQNLARLGLPPRLVSIVGDDANGRALLRHLRRSGIAADGVAVSRERGTAEYIAVIGPDRDLAFGMADMAVFDDLTIDHVSKFWPDGAGAAWAFADCNVPESVMRHLIARRRATGVRLAIDGVSVAKVGKLPRDLSGVDLLFLNADEGAALAGASRGSPDAIVERLCERGAESVVLTLGADGLLVRGRDGARTCRLPAVPSEPVDATGAGDALVAATIHGLATGVDVFAAVRRGTLAAALTIERAGSVRSDMSTTLLAANERRFGDVRLGGSAAGP